MSFLRNDFPSERGRDRKNRVCVPSSRSKKLAINPRAGACVLLARSINVSVPTGKENRK